MSISSLNTIPPAPPVIPEFKHINRYWDKRMKMHAAKILPGECYVSAHGEMISTVLGSCISACIRDTKVGVGGMNHFMLPIQHEGHSITRLSSINSDLCYGNWAMEYLINAILKQGGSRKNLEVKLFGGGRVLEGMSKIDVGKRNIEFVLDYIKRDGLHIVAKDLGSDHPRKVLFFPDTGSVKMKRLHTVENRTVEIREKAYLESMEKKGAESGDIELF